MGKKNGLVRRAGEEKRMDSNNIHLRSFIKIFVKGIPPFFSEKIRLPWKYQRLGKIFAEI